MYYSSDFDHSCMIRFSWIVKKGDWFSWTKWTTSFGFLFTDFLFSSVLLILWDLRPAQHATVLMFFFLSPLQFFSGDVGWGTLRTTRSSCEYHLVPQSFYTWWNSIGKLNFGENVSMECFCLLHCLWRFACPFCQGLPGTPGIQGSSGLHGDPGERVSWHFPKKHPSYGLPTIS